MHIVRVALYLTIDKVGTEGKNKLCDRVTRKPVVCVSLYLFVRRFRVLKNSLIFSVSFRNCSM